VPAARPVLFCVVRPLLQAKVYGAFAPLGVKFIAPLFNPQLVFVTVEEIVTAVEAVIVMEDVAVQLFALVTVTEYVPSASPVLFCVVRPLLQAKVYGDVAPLGVRFMNPLFNPQLVLVTAVEIDTADEAVMVMDEVAVQLLALVTVTLKVPAASAEMSSLVDPLLQIKV
jgi:hypothetical protein